MTKIGLIGYGYWGNIIAQILFNEGYEIEKLFTSKKMFLNISHCHEVIPISQMSIEAIQSLTHLFVLTGSPFHHAILKDLEKGKITNDLPFIWLEKPYITSRLQSNCNPCVAKNIYVDYPYSRENAEPSFLKAVNSYQNDSCIEINIFSRHNIERSFGIVFDFIPHAVSLINFFVKDFNSLVYCNWSIEEKSVQFPTTCIESRAMVYSFEAISDLDGNKFIVRFGIDNPQSSYLSFNKRASSVHSVNSSMPAKISTHLVNLADAFKKPVNQNIRRFLSTKPTDLLNCSAASFHDLIYQISANAELEFSKIRQNTPAVDV